MQNELEVLNKVATKTFFETGGFIHSAFYAKRDVEKARKDMRDFDFSHIFFYALFASGVQRLLCSVRP